MLRFEEKDWDRLTELATDFQINGLDDMEEGDVYELAALGCRLRCSLTSTTANQVRDMVVQ